MAAKRRPVTPRADYSNACLEHAPVPMAKVEGERHLLQHVNAAFCRLLDRPPEELVGKPFAEVVAQPDCLELLDRVYRTGKPASHTAAQRPTGPQVVFWSYLMWPVLAEGQPAGVMLQVTE